MPMVKMLWPRAAVPLCSAVSSAIANGTCVTSATAVTTPSIVLVTCSGRMMTPSSPSRLAADAGGDEMRPEADQFGYPLDGACHLQRHGPVDRIGHPRVQVAEYERRSLDADQVRDLQPGFGHLVPQLAGPVAEG